jgi:hypothetical protein
MEMEMEAYDILSSSDDNIDGISFEPPAMHFDGVM